MRRFVRLLALACSLGTAGCAGGGSERDTGERARPDRAPVLLLAVDGLEWSQILPLARAGELPTVARLLREGNFGRLRSMLPTFSPIIWTTVATGKAPARHGILGFGKTDGPDGPIVSMFDNDDRTTKAFWNILSDSGFRTAVIGWWMTYPVDEIEGLMVAQVNTLDQVLRMNRVKGGLVAGVEHQIHPPEREAELLARHERARNDFDGFVERTFGRRPRPATQLGKRLWEEVRWALAADATYVEIARHCRPESFDVFALYLGATDVLGHRYWRHAHPEDFDRPPPAEEIAESGDILAGYYRSVDRFLGELLGMYPEPVTVIIVSDHGMRAYNTDHPYDDGSREAPLTGSHDDAPPGVVIVAGPGVRAPPAPRSLAELEAESLPFLGSVADVTPTLLAHLGLPIGADMEGEVWWSVLERRRGDARFIESHDDEAWRQDRARRREREIELPAVDARLEQLRALGYVE